MTKTYTIDEAVDSAGYGKFQILVTFLAGMGWLADAFEILLLSVLGDYLACEWHMYHWQASLLTSVVFLAMLLGCPVFGKVADVYGRKIALAVAMVLMFVFGALSAASPSYAWVAVLRALMGFALGGLAQGLTLCVEYLPSSARGRGAYYLAIFWAVGTVLMALANWAVMSTIDNWRVLLAIAAIPALVVVISLPWYPESARFYLISGQYDNAVKVLERMASMNKIELPEGELLKEVQVKNRGKFMDLLLPHFRTATLLFWYIWFASSFTYYGIALVSPALISVGSLREAGIAARNLSMDKVVPCVKHTKVEFIDLLWTSSAEFPALVIFLILVDLVSRKKLLIVSCGLSSLFIFLLLIETRFTWLIKVFLFAARGLILAIFQLVYVMTGEDFPTAVRAIALGAGCSFARFGGLTVPYIAQVLFSFYPIIAILILGSTVVLAAVCAYFLPIDMQGVNMEEAMRKYQMDIENVQHKGTAHDVAGGAEAEQGKKSEEGGGAKGSEEDSKSQKLEQSERKSEGEESGTVPEQSERRESSPGEEEMESQKSEEKLES